MTLVRNPSAAEAMIALGRTLRNDGVSPRDREMVILRTGCNCSSGYELAQHQRIGLESGLSALEIRAVLSGPEDDTWSETESALLRACDELHSLHRVSDETWSALVQTYTDPQLIQFVMLVGYYHLVSFALNTHLGSAARGSVRPFLDLPDGSA